jgi:hypothetical protein
VRKILGRIKAEFLEILPTFIFFLVMFHILFVTRALTLKEYGIALHSHAMALIGALVVSKAIFIADKFPFLNFYPRQPLIVNVLSKTVVFGIFTFLFLFTEELVHQMLKHGGVIASFDRLTADIAWPVFWSGEIWVAVLLFFYCVASELIRVVGVEKTRAIFFKRVR